MGRTRAGKKPNIEWPNPERRMLSEREKKERRKRRKAKRELRGRKHET